MSPAPAPAVSVVPPYVRGCRRCRRITFGVDLCSQCTSARRAEVELAREYGEAPRPFSAFLAEAVS